VKCGAAAGLLHCGRGKMLWGERARRSSRGLNFDPLPACGVTSERSGALLCGHLIDDVFD
jgi:hypothetical protein